MKIIKPSFEILTVNGMPLSNKTGKDVLKFIELIGRVCYKSEDKITDTSAEKMVRSLVQRGHESVIEHFVITVRIVCDRGVTHEIVRHRIGSYSQESTRYCNYKTRGIQIIEPFFFEEGTKKYDEWLGAMKDSEKHYNKLIELGASPQEARSVLPNSLKTEIVVTYNLREWRHFFKMRCSEAAHPQMREVAIPILKEFQEIFPVFFDDLNFDL